MNCTSQQSHSRAYTQQKCLHFRMDKCMNVQGSFLLNSQKVEMTQVSITRRTGKHIAVQSTEGILLSSEKEQSPGSGPSVAGSHRYIKREIRQTEKSTCCMILLK